MARIILILNTGLQATYIIEDPRPARAVMTAINTGNMVVGPPEIDMKGVRQWAMAHRVIDVVTVVIDTPPVELSPRLYDVLFGLADGKSSQEIADDLGLSVRVVYNYVRAIKDRFREYNLRKVLAMAEEYGFLD